MWGLSSLFLATWQFFTTLGLLSVLAAGVFASLWVLLFCKWQWKRQQKEAWLGVYRFWVRFFALALTLCFSVSIPLIIQVGTVWPSLLMKVVAVLGPLLSLAVLLAFVTKLVFLNIMLYQQNRVANWLHNMAILWACLGFSAVLYIILVIVSWMSEPQGTEVINGITQVEDWYAILTQPQILWRFLGFVVSAFAIQGFLMMGISAWQALQRPLNQTENLSFKVGLGAALFAAVLGSLIYIYGAFFEPELMVAYQLPDLSLVTVLRVVLVLLLLMVLWTSVRVFAYKREPARMSAIGLRLYSGLTFGAALWVFVSLLLAAQQELPALVGEAIFIVEVFRDPGFWPLVFSTLAYLALFIALLYGFVQMLYHAARFGVVPVRKIRRTA